MEGRNERRNDDKNVGNKIGAIEKEILRGGRMNERRKEKSKKENKNDWKE